MSLTTAAEIDTAVAQATADPYTGLPRAVVMVAGRDGLLYSNAKGYAQLPPCGSSPEELAAAEKVTPDSIFELWSCTKLITVIAALQLVEQGRLALDAYASQFVPELKDVKILPEEGDKGDKANLHDNDVPITIEMLINHTAGFAYNGSSGVRFKYKVDNKIPDASGPGNAKESITKMPLLYKPGSTWNYGTSNDWLCFVIEAISGQDFETHLQENVFKPLGISDCSFITPNPRKINMAYTPTPATDPYKVGPGAFDCPYGRAYGGHGLLGSPASYIKVLQAILNGGAAPGGGARILRAETVAKMFEPTLNDVQQTSLKAFARDGNNPFCRIQTDEEYAASKGPTWGLGGALSQEDFSSGRKKGSLTWSGMASTYWVIDPASGVTFVVFTNVLPYGPQQIWDLWEKVEVLLYEGLSA